MLPGPLFVQYRGLNRIAEVRSMHHDPLAGTEGAGTCGLYIVIETIIRRYAQEAIVDIHALNRAVKMHVDPRRCAIIGRIAIISGSTIERCVEVNEHTAVPVTEVSLVPHAAPVPVAAAPMIGECVARYKTPPAHTAAPNGRRSAERCATADATTG